MLTWESPRAASEVIPLSSVVLDAIGCELPWIRSGSEAYPQLVLFVHDSSYLSPWLPHGNRLLIPEHVAWHDATPGLSQTIRRQFQVDKSDIAPPTIE